MSSLTGRWSTFSSRSTNHHDPLRVGGALVYRLFAMEMLVRLARIGFTTTMHDARSPRHGIYGNNAFVFVAQKHH